MSWRRLNQIKLAYDLYRVDGCWLVQLTAVFNEQDQYASSPGKKAYCYVELTVLLPGGGCKEITSSYCTYHIGMARQSQSINNQIKIYHLYAELLKQSSQVSQAPPTEPSLKTPQVELFINDMNVFCSMFQIWGARKQKLQVRLDRGKVLPQLITHLSTNPVQRRSTLQTCMCNSTIAKLPSIPSFQHQTQHKMTSTWMNVGYCLFTSTSCSSAMLRMSESWSVAIAST